jgi:hypothetical protein
MNPYHLNRLAIPIVFAAALVGCSGDSSSTPQSAGPSTATTPQPTKRGPSDPAKPEQTSPTSAREDPVLGMPLSEPENYYGVYATADNPDRRWFIAAAKRSPYAEQAPEVPPGHLALGATFGDVAPWQMKTISKTELAQAQVPLSQAEPVVIQFELDEKGHATAFRFTGGPHSPAGLFSRVADLPAGW